ncbi:hypothetical protein [Pseudonocardia sp. GCM10023141]|uniref:hypothetical protein n=1 Tax=Pseudonocardia sp. GCM10023141 TaxID=3252653 RepID=UPI00361E7643
MTEPILSALWCTRLADVLADTAEQVGDLVGRLVQDWPDAHGSPWLERAGLLHRELDRQAADASQLGAELTREHADPVAAAPPPPVDLVGALLAAAHNRGARLAGTDGTRADPDRGMRIAELPGSTETH